MAPPTMLRLAQATGDSRYADFVHAEWKATTDYLFDPAEQLYFRDSRFFDMRDAEGRKLFWSRGNGWVMAGRSEEHTSELQSLMRISYAVFCLKKKTVENT